MDGWTGGIGNKDQLSPAKAGAGAEPELGIIRVVKTMIQLTYGSSINTKPSAGSYNHSLMTIILYEHIFKSLER